MRVAYYITDHGFGHAARSIAVIGELCKKGYDVTVINSCAYSLLKSNLSSYGCRFENRKTDVGPVYEISGKTFKINWPATEKKVSSYLSEFDKKVREETAFLSSFDIAIGDVVAHAFPAAQNARIPGILLSNYSWASIYKNKLSSGVVKEFQCAYSTCSLQLEMPFALPFSGVRKVKQIGLVARRPTGTRQGIRKKLKLKSKAAIAYLGFGGWETSGLNPVALPNQYEYVIAGKTFPPYVANGQDYLAACNVAIAKAGYSTVAEAIASQTRMICIELPGSYESRVICNAVRQNKLGIAISWKDFTINDNLNEAISHIESLKIKPPVGRFAEIGEVAAIAEIEKLVK